MGPARSRSWCASLVGQGTTIKLYLPRAEPGQAVAQKSAAKQELPRGSERILLVEDDDSVRAALLRMMSRLGYAVVVAADGPSALATLATEPFDLLIIDLVMPGGMDGSELAGQARRHQPGLPVVLMTGYAEAAGTLVDGLEGLGPVLAKPFQPQQPAAAIRLSFEA